MMRNVVNFHNELETIGRPSSYEDYEMSSGHVWIFTVWVEITTPSSWRNGVSQVYHRFCTSWMPDVFITSPPSLRFNDFQSDYDNLLLKKKYTFWWIFIQIFVQKCPKKVEFLDKIILKIQNHKLKFKINI